MARPPQYDRTLDYKLFALLLSFPSFTNNFITWNSSIRATLDEGPRSRSQWNRTILLAESHKLGPLPLDERPWPKSGKLKLNLHGTYLEGKSIGSNPKKDLQESSWFGEPKCKLGSNSRIQFASNESKLIPRNFHPGPHLKCGLRFRLRIVITQNHPMLVQTPHT
jgi:hypothetical protein